MPDAPTAPNRLTAERRDLAAAYVPLARRIARGAGEKLPHLAHEIESAAMWGLCDAARRFDPARGFRFVTYAAPRVAWSVRDAIRRAPPVVPSLDAPIAPGKPSTLADTIPADELPVGWEIESQDAVDALSRRFPNATGALLRLIYTRADTATTRAAGRALGLGRSRAFALHGRAMAFLRDRLDAGEVVDGR